MAGSPEGVIVRVGVLAQDPVGARVMLDDECALTTGVFPWYLVFALRELFGVPAPCLEQM
jgi:hypothetical protein